MGNWAKQARLALSEGNYTQAGDFFKLDGNPKAAVKAYLKGNNHVEAARIYEDLGNLRRAEKILLKNSQPKDIAEFHLRHQNPDKAVEIFLNHQMDYEAAELLESQRQFNRSASLYARLGFNEKAGVLYGKARNYDKAIEQFDSVVELLERSKDTNVTPKINKFKEWIANLHIAAKRFRQAGQVFEEIQQKEKAAKCYLKGGMAIQAANLLLELDRVADAEQILRPLKSLESRVLLGKIALQKSQYQEAAQLLADTGEDVLLSAALEKTGQFRQAAFYLEKAGKLAEAAALYAKARDHQKAAILYEQNGLYQDAAYNYEKLKKYALAGKLYHLAKNRYKAGLCLYKVDRLNDALKQLQHMDTADEHYAKGQALMAEIFFKQGVFSVARKLLEDLTSKAVLDEETMPTFYRLARCFEEEGDLETAKAYYERIVARKFDFGDVAARLKRLQGVSRSVINDSLGSSKDGASPYEVSVGDTIAERFKIISTIGKGGMGFIFKVRDLSLDRNIALKMLIHDRGDFEELKKELLIARDLTHPYIIKVFDVGQWMTIGYFTMEFVEGQPLKQYILQSKEEPLSKKIELLIKICEGLKAAHEQEVVHRDIKPQNIMIDHNFNPKILDFGIARKMTHGQRHKAISGSPKYMSPEQIQNHSTDRRTDIYALGVIMFYMFTLKEPFIAKTPQEVMYMHLEKPLPEPVEVNPAIPYWLSDIIKKCCQKNPVLRFNDMGELIDEFKLNLMDFNA